ncbi:MAG: hypothetical protein ACI8QS_003587 [Planctomycetota bacterium]|jgi:hypothetical protein
MGLSTRTGATAGAARGDLHRIKLPTVLCLGMLLGVLTGPGCRARRTLAVTSDPGEARILLDDRVIGETPKRHEFQHYGVRRICLSKDGHRTRTEFIDLKAPWYGRFPMDILTEVFIPIGWRDRRTVHINLPEGEEEFSIPGIQSVVERARVLRNAGMAGPGELPPIQARVLPTMSSDPLELLDAESRGLGNGETPPVILDEQGQDQQ